MAAAGCVTRGTHREVITERDQLQLEKRRLEERVELLEASNESLGSERLKLIDEMEDLRHTRAQLDKDVRRLRRAEEQLAASLRSREAELASRSQDLESLHSTYEELVADLESEVASGQIEIEQLREGLRLNMPQDILFASGSARLNPTGAAVLRKLALRLAKLPHRVEVQGHTDDVPIRSTQRSRFPSNWELAAARAAEVVRLLAGEGVDAVRLTAVSYGEFHPVASNETPEGRARNRRIEIRLEPELDAAAPEQPAGPAAMP